MRSGRSTRARSRVRIQWLVLAAALVVLAGTLVAWALGRAAERVTVVSVSRPVAAGDVIEPGDLGITDVAVDADITGLIAAESLPRLAGRVATIALEPGMLLTAGMWAEDTELAADERTVGAVLAAGRYPSGIVHGSVTLTVDVRDSSATAVPAVATATQPGAVGPLVRVLEATTDESGDLHVTLAVPLADAERIARLAATDSLAIVGVPAVAP